MNLKFQVRVQVFRFSGPLLDTLVSRHLHNSNWLGNRITISNQPVTKIMKMMSLSNQSLHFPSFSLTFILRWMHNTKAEDIFFLFQPDPINANSNIVLCYIEIAHLSCDGFKDELSIGFFTITFFCIWKVIWLNSSKSLIFDINNFLISTCFKFSKSAFKREIEKNLNCALLEILQVIKLLWHDLSA